MGVMNEAAVESIELEQVGKEIQLLWPNFRGLFNLLDKSAKKTNIANTTLGGDTPRSAWRESMLIQGASGINVGTGDGDAITVNGTGSKTAAFSMAPVYVFNTTVYTHLAELATEGAERGVESITKTEMKRSVKQFYNGIESLFNGDGSGAIDQIPNTAVINDSTGTGDETSSIVGVSTAAAFVDQQYVQFFAAESGSPRAGTFKVSYVDVVNQTLYFSTALTGVSNGDYIMVAGASGAVGSSVLGVPYWNTAGYVGTKGGLSLAQYPSRLSTPVINLGGAQVTPSVVQRARVLLSRALGDDSDELDNGVWYGRPEQAATIASQWYTTLISQNLEGGGINATDRARKGLPETFGERTFVSSNTAKPGRIDLLFPEKWAIGELCPVRLYNFASGAVVWPVMNSSGQITSAKQFVYEWGGQLCNLAPRHGLFITNASTIKLN